MTEARGSLSSTPPSHRSMPPTRADIFNDPEAYEALKDGFLPKNIAASIAISAFASALAFTTNRALTGAWSALGAKGVAASLALLAAASALTVATRAPLLARDRERFWQMLTVQGAAHLTWLYLVCLLVENFFAVLGLAALLAWIFNDTRYLYDSSLLRRQYLAPAAAIDVALGALGLLRPDLAARLLPARGGLLVFGAVQLGLVVLTQALIVTVGRQNRDRDLRTRELQDLTRQVAVHRKEREVLERAARLMTSGLYSVKFAHDVASPLSVLNVALDDARETLADRLRAGAPAAADALTDLDEMLSIAHAAQQRVLAMSDVHATALRQHDPMQPEAIEALFAQAWREAAATLASHGVKHPQEPSFTLSPASVFVTAGHASTFSNLLTNGALQSPHRPIEVRGAPCGECFYQVVIRDHGVAPEARAAALARIERSLSLDGEASNDPMPRRYRGYGIALSIARVLLVRYNGWLSARAPDEGPGVEFCVVLPRVAPETIPHEANTPELYA